MTDTTTEAVERLAERFAARWHGIDPDSDSEVAATLRALAQERDDEKMRADTNAEAHAAAMRCVRLVETERDAARAVLARWQHYGCPDCGGDCASENLPVACCIMQETRAALATTEDKQ